MGLSSVPTAHVRSIVHYRTDELVGQDIGWNEDGWDLVIGFEYRVTALRGLVGFLGGPKERSAR